MTKASMPAEVKAVASWGHDLTKRGGGVQARSAQVSQRITKAGKSMIAYINSLNKLSLSRI